MALKLNEINLSNVADWPVWIKSLSALIIFSACTFAGYWFYAKNTLDNLSTIQKKESQLKTSVALKMKQAVSLPQYQAQIEELKGIYESMIQQLPNSKEVPQLVDDITSVGVRAGLTFRLIRPMPEKVESFYATLPIEISVSGTYDELGQFISGISALPRIVMIHDFSIRPSGKEGAKQEDGLNMTIKANTYRYLNEDEQRKPSEKGVRGKGVNRG